MAYPDAGREDYLDAKQDASASNEESAQDLQREAGAWVGMGVQVIGTCCGFGPAYIKGLEGALPDRISVPRVSVHAMPGEVAALPGTPIN